MRLLPLLTRTYATTTRPTRLTKTPPLSLDHFLLRQRVLAQYRTIIRACRKVPEVTREEMQRYAREEFERQKGVEDLRRIRYLLSVGKVEFERLVGGVSVGS
ncbi:hypothetical protein N7G274_008909 [Stereocaulon virgatum]|uniref:LYR motif-containing protein 2 n=1 Tax=Stereocaulon virgatum TaxID=373712 RepID=A0ABR3ZYH2_9LECA